MPDATLDTAAAAKASADATAATQAAADAATALAAATPIAPVIPEKYTLALPEGSLMSPKALERATVTAKALKIMSDADAQSLVGAMDAEAREVRGVYEAARQPGGTVHQEIVAQNTAESLTHPQLGNGDPALLEQKTLQASLVLNATVHGRGLVAFLNQNGAAQHPLVLLYLNEIHGERREKPLLMGGDIAPPSTEPIEKRFYPQGVQTTPK